jgi:hypothetical protein
MRLVEPRHRFRRALQDMRAGKPTHKGRKPCNVSSVQQEPFCRRSASLVPPPPENSGRNCTQRRYNTLRDGRQLTPTLTPAIPTPANDIHRQSSSYRSRHRLNEKRYPEACATGLNRWEEKAVSGKCRWLAALPSVGPGNGGSDSPLSRRLVSQPRRGHRFTAELGRATLARTGM